MSPMHTAVKPFNHTGTIRSVSRNATTVVEVSDRPKTLWKPWPLYLYRYIQKKKKIITNKGHGHYKCTGFDEFLSRDFYSIRVTS